MLSLTAPKFRIVLSFIIAALLAGIAWNYSPDLVATAAAGKVVPATKRGPATIVLQDGYDLPAAYDDARPGADARPKNLASADFDVDGFPDLVSGYATEKGGYIVIQRGNPEAFAPTLPENVQAVAESRFPVAFLPETKIIELTSTPDFIAVGDFDRDTNPDVITASRGGSELNLIAGNGKGEFSAARKIAMPGSVTTLASGQIDLPDNLDDLVVGIDSDAGSSLLVFEGKNGIADEPIGYRLPASAEIITLGQMDDSPWMDATVLAGGQISILHGRNQRDGRESARRAASRLEQIDVPFPVRSFALGEFIFDRDARNELALLSDDGSVAFVTRGTLDTRPRTIREARELRLRQMSGGYTARLANWKPDSTQSWNVAENLDVMDTAAVSQALSNKTQVLFGAYLSGQAAADLVVVDAASRQLKIFAVEAPPKGEDGEVVSFAGPRAEMTLPVANAPVAALSMRTGLFVRPGLVFLKEGSTESEIIPAAPTATFTVSKTADTADGVCNADCSLREAHVASNGAAGADIITIPNGTYQLTIANGGGSNEDGGTAGDIDVNESITMNGTAAATTIIQAGTTTSNGIDKVYGFNPLCTSPVSNSINNVTFRFGRNTQANGAPDISFTGGGADYCNTTAAGTMTVTNSVFSDNTVANSFGGGLNISTLPDGTGAVSITNSTFNNNKTPTDSFDAKGAGIRGNGSGNLTITGSTISNNQSGTTPNIGSSALGGGMMIDQPTGAIQIQNTTISGNTAQRHGGGVAIDRPDGVATSAVTINQGSTITGNTSNGGDTVGGGGQGGGIYANVNAAGTVTLTGITITNNVALAGTRGGGGIASSLGSMNISFCRIAGNTSSQGTGVFKTNAGGTITATNNWWGCSGGPGTTGCQTTLVTAPSVLTTSPFLQLRTTAATNPIVTGQTSALTASFLTNSAGTAIAVGNLGTLIGQTVTWSGVGGGISAAQTTIQAAGTATATYTGTAVGAGSATAQVDGGPASGSTNTVAITVNKANTTASIISDSPDPSNVGQNVTVAYSVAVTAPGGGTPGGNVQVSDGVNSCTGTVAAGSCQVALSTTGNRTLTATYQGDTNYNASPASAGAGHLVGTVTWTGATDSTFSTNTNWNTGLAPGTGDTAVIPTGATNQPTIGSAASVSSLSVASGRILTVNSTLTVGGTLTNNGTIQGTGTIVNNFSNGGILAPGLSPGILNITGTFVNTGSVNIEIGGTGGPGVNPNGHDQLLVSGTVTLGGTLNVTLTNGFTPTPGQSFVIVDGATLSGNFTTANVPNILPNVWSLTRNPANGVVTLSVLSPTAANVTVAGRVFADGQGLRNAIVTITNSNGVTRSTRTSSFGYYGFSDIESGREYVISVASKGYTFVPRIVSVNDSVTGLDFTASQ